MSDLEFFDVFRMFLGELESRQFDPQSRAMMLQNVIESLKRCLVSPGQPVRPINPFAEVPYSPSGNFGSQQMMSPQPQQYQQMAPQQMQQPPMQQQYQEPQYDMPPDQQYQDQGPPPDQQQFEEAPPPQQSGMSDEEALQNISQTVYGTGLRVNNVYKSLNVSGTGISDAELVEGLQKLGVKVDGEQIIRLAEPYKTKDKLKISGFIRMLAAGGGD